MSYSLKTLSKTKRTVKELFLHLKCKNFKNLRFSYKLAEISGFKNNPMFRNKIFPFFKRVILHKHAVF
jgi:hypothetical protein